MIPTANVTLDLDIDLDTTVQVIDHDVMDADDYDGRDPMRTLTLGELVAEKLLDRADAGGLVATSVRMRLARITEEEIRDAARRMIARVLDKAPYAGTLTAEDVTLAQMVEAQIHKQFTDPAGGAVTRGRETPVIDAVVATAVTTRLRELADDVTVQVRDRVLAEIAGNHG